MSILLKLALSVLIGGAIFAVIALTLIASDGPTPDLRAEAGAGARGLDFTTLPAASTPSELHHFTARDGQALGYRRWEATEPDAPLVVAIHGSGWHGMQFEALGAALASQGLADVVAPDLRGHGPLADPRGDIAYIGQFEDDLAELIAGEARDGQEVILLGHSSGGGLVVRFAGGAHGGLMDRAILLAPFLQYDAPTARAGSGGWARVMTRRIIGLSMLNMVGLRALNHLPVIEFRFPDAVLDGPYGETATRAYSYRLNTGFAPRRDWPADVRALPEFLLVAGRSDEAFIADAYAPTLREYTERGRYALVDSAHLDVVDHPETFDLIADFLRRR
ncbi:alpha/beta hydrolase [Pararhodobacter oceanensis]|uniref:Alpha/beta hydrolase n=1 Tax=Pararhodobacter oceanensis TaxID=2172121 RepID=A0A2T8HY62_9RHOB|nr:alpha/beta fold hydrolase [Pararhodobacter oceanensis]PVH30386.1 alpha/beta hydrolase [Pararhodobacter oceanensis]